MSDVVKLHRVASNVRVVTSRGIHHAFPPLTESTIIPHTAVQVPAPPPVEDPPPAVVTRGEDRLMRISREDEYNRGFAEGKAAAEDALRGEYEARLLEEHNRVAGALNTMQRQLDHLYEKIEREAFQFSLAVAGRIVEREVTLDDQIVVRQVREAIRRVVGVESIKLRVHPLDEPVIRGQRNVVLSSTDSVRELIIEADEKVERGGCIIESASGNIDARRSTQLKQIEAALFGSPSAAAGEIEQ